ncbi:hypothetical protein ACWC09_03425 [Streptomyces sp. NPDC001617]
MNRHFRKAAVVTAAITAGLVMTACQNGSTHSSGSTGSDSSTGSAGSQHTSVAKTSKTSGSSSKQGSGTAAQNASSSQQGVSGTFAGGTVSYVAPGKYIVHISGKTDQAFFVADGTQVYGAGTICGSARCTLDELETATRKAAVTADVTMSKGVATVVRERRDAATGTGKKGVNGTWFGNVSYLAPGKYTVSDQKGFEQAFYVADDTKVYGAGTICGDSASSGTTRCTLDQLEAAVKKGLDAEVRITDGVATTITEDH